MKQLIGNGANSYTFSPGAAGSGTVTISGLFDLRLQQIMIITNLTRDSIIYIPQVTGKGNNGFSTSNGVSVLTLDFDTSTHSSGDVLQIWYDNSDQALVAIADLSLEIKNLINIIASPAWADARGLRIGPNPEGSIGNISSVSALGTMNSLTSLERLASQPYNFAMQDMLLNTAFQGIRNQIITAP